jgi:hypothetical protein
VCVVLKIDIKGKIVEKLYNFWVSKVGLSFRAVCIEFPEIIVYAPLPDLALSLIKERVSSIIENDKKMGFMCDNENIL